MPDALDRKLMRVFPGKVVRKDLVGAFKGQFNAPTYVLEYLLGKYCSSDDELVVECGLEEVKRILTDNFVRPDQAELFKARVRERGGHRVIDKVKVQLVETEDKYWASLVNLQLDHVHIDEELVNRFERLLAGGVWAQIEMVYDAGQFHKGQIRPFVIQELRPIQLATAGLLSEIQEARPEFEREEWVDVLLRSAGLEPAQMEWRLKLLYLSRLIPIVENNFNLVEFGPRGTGKSYVYRELTPFAILVSGGDVTVPRLFMSLSGKGRIGLVGLWDVVAFDEVAGLTRLADGGAVNILKDYMEAGSFSRGREEITATASLVFVGNINVDIDTVLRTAHLFTPFPREMQDLAFLDRLHMYLSGWEVPKMHASILTGHYGLVADYLAQVFQEMRKLSFADAVDRHFHLGPALNKRDEKAVRKTVSGLVKLIHPDGQYRKEELAEYLRLALEMRRRVKEQLRRMGGIEYWNVSFSYTDTVTGKEEFVGVPEQQAGGMIPPDPQAPGVVFTVGLDAETGKEALFRVEVGFMKGTGRYNLTGAVGRAMREAVRTAHDYLRANVGKFAVDRSLADYDAHIQVVNLMQAKEGSQTGSAFFVALVSALFEKAVASGSVVLGEMTIRGDILAVRNLGECLQLVKEHGGRRVLLPVPNLRDLSILPPDLISGLDVAFYADPRECILKALSE